jgi:hypothetical protein
MIEIAIILATLGFVLYVILVIQRRNTGKKKKALANLAGLYERRSNRHDK